MQEQIRTLISFPMIQETYYDFSICQPAPSGYIQWKYTVEATDQEIINYAAQSPTFDFLNEPEEDIYCLDDGEPV